MKKGVTLAIRSQSNESPKKVTKIMPFKEGGFAVLTPYHKSQEGFVAKLPVNYRDPLGTTIIPRAQIEGYTVSDRVKLSYHPDGFAQFSGEDQGKVISGRDRETGEPKGIGLMTHRLAEPIQSGPTFGVTLWGLEDFEELAAEKADTLVFGEEDWYYRRCTDETANGWLVEVFVFPTEYWAAVRKRGDRYFILMNLPRLEGSGGAVIELSVIQLPQQPVFLAGFVSRVRLDFKHPTSGWTLNGPGQYDQTGRGHVLMAWYPRSLLMSEDAAGSVDFTTPDEL